MMHVIGDPRLTGLAAMILYRTLGPTLPEDRREGAVLFGLAFRFAMAHGPSLARAGFVGRQPKQPTRCSRRSSTAPRAWCSRWTNGESVVASASAPRTTSCTWRSTTCSPRSLRCAPRAHPIRSYPFVLSAGERRSFTANTIIRNPSWRRKDELGALRISPEDAAALEVASGDRLRLVTKRDRAVVAVEVSSSMQRGHVSLPNGLGVGYPDKEHDLSGGIAPNELTAVEDRDPFVGTPWHKNVPARLERI